MRVRHLAALTLAVAVCALVGSTPAISGAPAGPPPPPNCDPDAIQVDDRQDFGYDPDTLTVPVGTTVCWINQDMTPHTVTSDVQGVFDSGSLHARPDLHVHVQRRRQLPVPLPAARMA